MHRKYTNSVNNCDDGYICADSYCAPGLSPRSVCPCDFLVVLYLFISLAVWFTIYCSPSSPLLYSPLIHLSSPSLPVFLSFSFSFHFFVPFLSFSLSDPLTMFYLFSFLRIVVVDDYEMTQRSCRTTLPGAEKKHRGKMHTCKNCVIISLLDSAWAGDVKYSKRMMFKVS